jgi:hypothetical protein
MIPGTRPVVRRDPTPVNRGHHGAAFHTCKVKRFQVTLPARLIPHPERQGRCRKRRFQQRARRCRPSPTSRAPRGAAGFGCAGFGWQRPCCSQAGRGRWRHGFRCGRMWTGRQPSRPPAWWIEPGETHAFARLPVIGVTLNALAIGPDGRISLAAGDNGKLLRSTDGGMTWAAVPEPIQQQQKQQKYQ